MVKIENLTNRLVSLRLNSGTTLHLPPRATSPELVNAEVQSNAEAQKLQERQVIALQDIAAVEEEHHG
jgi:hypothetical protein